MNTTKILQAALIAGAVMLAGCTNHVTQTDKYSGFLGDYST